MANDKEKFALTMAEINSPSWCRLMEYFADRLAQLRAENDTDKDEVQTAKQRGRIAEIKALMALDKEYE
jgi:hypothetical protein